MFRRLVTSVIVMGINPHITYDAITLYIRIFAQYSYSWDISFKNTQATNELMNIVKIVKSGNEFFSYIYDEDLNLIESESFADNYTTNFYLQTLPRKFKIRKALLVIEDKNRNTVDLLIAENEDSFFIR
ncbi:MAG: hypothetical protein ACJ71R_19755 [Nitrososphaeraceae archaeon]